MEEKKTLLILRLEGVLQAWGDHSKWDRRDSGDFPSKSGVVGLLACAMGLERGDPEIAALSSVLHMAVRADRPGVRILDLHTAQGYPLYNAEGKPRQNNTVLSRRWYLQDASFLAVLDLPDEWAGTGREGAEASCLAHLSWPEELCSVPPGFRGSHRILCRSDGRDPALSSVYPGGG